MNEQSDHHINKLFQFHLKILSEIIRGKNFDNLQELFSDEMHLLNYLQYVDQKLLTFHNGLLVGAYPVSPKPTIYNVDIQNIGKGYAMCAIDALGVAYTFMQKTTLTTTFKDTEEEFKVLIDPFDDSCETEIDMNIIYVAYKPVEEVTNIALQQCPVINFYKSKDYIDDRFVIMSFNEAKNSAKEQFNQEAMMNYLKQINSREKNDKTHNCCSSDDNSLK